MEIEVKTVGGINNCFVSLPLPLIQTIESTSFNGSLPPILALELRSRSGDCWHVAWFGSSSNSSSIEVAQRFAECISLPDKTVVAVKALGNIPKASFVSIEPNSEDDWEVLELNSELAEEAILQQVGIVKEGMKFPLWLHKHITIEFLVVSTSPKNSVVQLVPGTEVSVAPKVRKRRVEQRLDIPTQPLPEEQLRTRALLRVQALDKEQAHCSNYKGVELGVVPTTVGFIHPETAQKHSFNNMQLVTVLPRLLSPDGKLHNGKDSTNHRRRSNNTGDEENNNPVIARHTFIRILLSDSVAKGHIMLPLSLRLFLQAVVHSWVYVKKFCNPPKKDISSLTLSPCHFKLLQKNRVGDINDAENTDSDVNLKRKSAVLTSNVFPQKNAKDNSQYEELISNLLQKISESTEGKKFLVQAWLRGQLKEIALQTAQTEVTSIVLTSNTLFHFKVVGSGSDTKESAVEFLYLVKATFGDSSLDELENSYELVVEVKNKNGNEIHELKLETENLELGDPVILESIMESNRKKPFKLSLSSLSWMENATSDVINRLLVLLSPSSNKLLSNFHVPLPGHILVHGPPGSGKSTLAMAVAKYFEEHSKILAHVIFVSCSKLSMEKSQNIRQAVTSYVSEASTHSPSIIIFDDLDNIVSSSNSDEAQPSSSIPIVKFLLEILDEFAEKYRTSCRYGPVAFMASAQSLEKIPQNLSSSGRFDFHVQLPAPAVSERELILKHEIQKRFLKCSDDVFSDIPSKCEGYDAYDLEILVDRAIHAAVSRLISSHNDYEEHETPILVKDDFSQAMQEFVPVAIRGLTKATSDGGRSGWDDVGGLIDIRNAIQEMIELPSKFPNIFASSPLRLRSNVLLYGPPGCGKTHIVGAAAAACSLRFISVKGPELLNKYIGASEQAVRDLFSKAASAAPCLLFFDEFDSIAPKRGHDNTGVTDRVVNQLLTELDGVEVLTGVFVFAATSRPDLLDAALLRPGRLDRLLFCDFPTWRERLDILTVLSKKLPLSDDVNLETIASMTEGFSGADLQALLSDAQLESVHDLLNSGDVSEENSRRMPVISDELLKSVSSKARPSVSEYEKQRLNGIYSQFLDAKKSATAQTKDSKGKRATLA